MDKETGTILRGLISQALARVPPDPAERWHAGLGVGLMVLLVCGELLILLGTAPANGWLSPPTVLIFSEWLVAALGLLWTWRTGRWRPAAVAVVCYTMAYLAFLCAVIGPSEPGLVISITGIIAAATFILGRRWTAPSVLLFAAVLGGLALSGRWPAESLSAAIGSCIGTILSLAIVSALFGMVETARKRAFGLARLRAEAEQAAAAAEALASARSTFLATMSHEIRTPLNGVLNLQRMLRDSELTQEQSVLLRTSLQSSEALLSVLNDVLDYSKLEAGQFKLEQRTFCLPRLVEEVAELHRAAAVEAGVALRVHVDETVPAHVLGDDTRVRQVLTNLISNATRFTPEGWVAVRVLGTSDDRILFEVEDTGIGIPEEVLPVIFRAFQQADTSTTRRFGGSGLGLTICRQLTEAMGGSISASSQVGVGSVFRVSLPLPAAAPPAPTAAPHPVAHRFESLHVLVAEDNAVNQLVIRSMLERLGASFEIVPDGRAAVERVQRLGVDLVLMDLHMPELDGLDATREIRALRSPASEVPIVALTASVMASDRERCMAAGMNAHIAKPIELETLARVLSQAETDGALRRVGR